MEYPFDALHAGIESQILNLPAGIPDSQAVRQAKASPDSVEKFLTFGKALSRQLRYREAIVAYTEGLKAEPENLSLLRLRAGRYLTTLQSDFAVTDFEKCLSLGAEKLDCLYRIGLAHYYAGRYLRAMETLESCLPLCDDGSLLAHAERCPDRESADASEVLSPGYGGGASYCLRKGHAGLERYNAACSGAGNAGEGRRRPGVWHYLVRPALASRLYRKRVSFPITSPPGRLLAKLCVHRCVERLGWPQEVASRR